MDRISDDTQLEQILALTRRVLGPNIAGAYLHGSGAFGGLKPHSDIDVLVVSRRTLTAPERRQLTDGLMAISGNGRGGQPRPVELTVVVASDVKPWHYPPRQDFLYGEWLRAEYAAGHVPQAVVNPDLAPLVAMTRIANRPLIGPPPADLLDPVPHGDLLRAITAGVDGLLADLDTDTANVLLTLARIWVTVATGEIRSKDAAADWVIARLPGSDRAVLARARAIYLGHEAYHWEDLQTQVRPTVDDLVAEVHRLELIEPG